MLAVSDSVFRSVRATEVGMKLTEQPENTQTDSAERNVRLLVAYDGTDFRGLAYNPGVRTVVGELRNTIGDLTGRKPDMIMSGRTDAGVHAHGQVLNFVLEPERWDELHRRGGLVRLQRSINARLGPEVVVREVDLAPMDFSARFSATGRRYRYTILNREVADPLTANSAWLVTKPLSLDAMEAACPYLLGEQDFSSFCRAPKPTELNPTPSLVRRVTGARWHDLSASHGKGVLRFDIEGTAFCHQMVRSIVGFLVAVGTGKRQADELPAVIAARDRNQAEQPAPPHGLVLWQVDY